MMSRALPIDYIVLDGGVSQVPPPSPSPAVIPYTPASVASRGRSLSRGGRLRGRGGRRSASDRIANAVIKLTAFIRENRGG